MTNNKGRIGIVHRTEVFRKEVSAPIERRWCCRTSPRQHAAALRIVPDVNANEKTPIDPGPPTATQEATQACKLAADILPDLRSEISSQVFFWPSFRSLSSARSPAEMWTKTSAPPSSGLMTPTPFIALNHLTEPAADSTSRLLRTVRAVIADLPDWPTTAQESVRSNDPKP